MDQVCVKVCALEYEALVVKGLLESNGIRVVLLVGTDVLAGSGDGGAQNVRVMVSAADAAEAANLLGDST